MKAILLPLDNRPVTSIFPAMVSEVAGLRAVLPPRSLLGSLDRPAQPGPLIEWMDAAADNEQPDALLLCVDSFLYGGLINSRRCTDTLSQVLEREAALRRWKRSSGAVVLAQSSIMRISDNYDATEEKAYWARYGREIFAWSSYLHRLARGTQLPAGALTAAEARIPPEIRQDYLDTRRRNLQVNRRLLEQVSAGIIDFLVLSLDDSGEAGLNVMERERLACEADRLEVSNRVACYPGTDEVLCAMLSRWVVSAAGRSPQVKVEYTSPEGARIPSRYEGQTIGETVRAQIAACGLAGAPSREAADMVLIVHCSDENQGDHIRLPDQADMRKVPTAASSQKALDLLRSCDKPTVICDVAYANGADPHFVGLLLQERDLARKIWAYAGWNTTGNTVGSALALGTARWFASRSGAGRTESASHAACLFVRLADDWAYQTQVRPGLDGPCEPEVLLERMSPHLDRICDFLKFRPACVSLSHPWLRPFEVEIDVGLAATLPRI